MAINNRCKFKKQDDGKQALFKVMNDLMEKDEKVVHYPSDVQKYTSNFEGVFANIVHDSGDYPNFELIIDDGVKVIHSAAFVECCLIESVYIPNSVEEIGTKAFEHCSSLSKVTFEEDSNLKTIGPRAFSMTNISSVDLPPLVETIGEFAFSGCPELASVTVPELVEVIPQHFCRDSTNLTKVVIKGDITEIGNQAFRNCALTEFDFKSSIKTIGASAFAHNELSQVDLSNTSVFSISNMTFSHNGVVDIKISPYTQIIGAGAFSYNQIPQETIDEILMYVSFVDNTAFEFQD